MEQNIRMLEDGTAGDLQLQQKINVIFYSRKLLKDSITDLTQTFI